MDWSFALAATGFAFMAVGTLLVIVSYLVKGKDPNQGWTFIVLGILLVVVFGVGIAKMVSALGFKHLLGAPG